MMVRLVIAGTGTVEVIIVVGDDHGREVVVVVVVVVVVGGYWKNCCHCHNRYYCLDVEMSSWWTNVSHWVMAVGSIGNEMTKWF